jgi:hypothetical protein
MYMKFNFINMLGLHVDNIDISATRVEQTTFYRHKHFTCRFHRHLGNQMYKKLTYLYTSY